MQFQNVQGKLFAKCKSNYPSCLIKIVLLVLCLICID